MGYKKKEVATCECGTEFIRYKTTVILCKVCRVREKNSVYREIYKYCDPKYLRYEKKIRDQMDNGLIDGPTALLGLICIEDLLEGKI